MPITDAGVSLVLPLFNEGPNVEEVVFSSRDFLGKEGVPFEIILVDDGSKDATPGVSDRLAASDPRIRVFHHPANRGYGAALATGFGAARHGIVVFMDADGQFDASEMGRLLARADDADIVAGFRLERRDPRFRVFLGRIYSRGMALLFGIGLRDLNCGFKLLKKSVLDRVRISTTGALVNGEIMIQAARMGCRVEETGVSHFPRAQGRQTGADFRVILNALAEAWRLFRRPPVRPSSAQVGPE